MFFWKSSPYVSDPSRFATRVTSSETGGDYSRYKEYDYVVVGGKYLWLMRAYSWDAQLLFLQVEQQAT